MLLCIFLNYTFIYKHFVSFLSNIHNTNNLHADVWFQLFLSNTNNLSPIIWFKVAIPI